MELISYTAISMNIILALVIRHANRVFSTQHYTVVYSLPSCFAFFFSHYLINGRILGKILMNTKRVLLLSTNLSKIFFIPRIIQGNMIKSVHKSLCKVPTILVRC